MVLRNITQKLNPKELIGCLIAGLILLSLASCGDTTNTSPEDGQSIVIPTFQPPAEPQTLAAIPVAGAIATNALQPVLLNKGKFRLSFADSSAVPNATAAVSTTRATQIERQLNPALQAFNAMLDLPDGDIPIVVRRCGLSNAFYVPAAREIVLCTELLDASYDAMLNLYDQDAQRASRVAGDVFTFFMFHEIAHALDDVLDLPIFGNVESAADAIATVLAAETGRPQIALFAAYLFTLSIDGSFGDVHHSGDDRAGDLVCWVLGSDPSLQNLEGMEQLAQQFVDAGRDCTGEYGEQRSAVQRWIPAIDDIAARLVVEKTTDVTLQQWGDLDEIDHENEQITLSAKKIMQRLDKHL